MVWTDLNDPKPLWHVACSGFDVADCKGNSEKEI